MTPAILDVAGLGFAYRDRAALSNVSFSIEPGVHAGVVGPNGAGKSTLLKILAGVLAPTAGVVRFEGTPLNEWKRLALGQRLAYVPQSVPPDVSYTAFEVVLAGRFPHVGYLVSSPPSIATSHATPSHVSTRSHSRTVRSPSSPAASRRASSSRARSPRSLRCFSSTSRRRSSTSAIGSISTIACATRTNAAD